MRHLAAFGSGGCGFRLGPSGSKAPAGGGRGRPARCPDSSARRTVGLKTGSAALRRDCCRAVASRSAQRCAGPEARERDERAGDRRTAWSGRRVRASSCAFGAERPAAEEGRRHRCHPAQWALTGRRAAADGRWPAVDGRSERWTSVRFGPPPTPSQKNTCSASSVFLRGGRGSADPARRCPPPRGSSGACPEPGHPPGRGTRTTGQPPPSPFLLALWTRRVRDETRTRPSRMPRDGAQAHAKRSAAHHQSPRRRRRRRRPPRLTPRDPLPPALGPGTAVPRRPPRPVLPRRGRVRRRRRGR